VNQLKKNCHTYTVLRLRMLVQIRARRWEQVLHSISSPSNICLQCQNT